MSSKIGDVYDGGRKIGEIHRSGGMGGCMSGILVLIAVIGGLIYLVTIGINHIRYGADSPAAATATAQAAICNSGQAKNLPSTDAMAQMMKTHYDANNDYQMTNMRNIRVVKQSGCSINVCVTYDPVPIQDGDIAPGTTTSGFELDYYFDLNDYSIRTGGGSPDNASDIAPNTPFWSVTGGQGWLDDFC